MTLTLFLYAVSIAGLVGFLLGLSERKSSNEYYEAQARFRRRSDLGGNPAAELLKKPVGSVR